MGRVSLASPPPLRPTSCPVAVSLPRAVLAGVACHGMRYQDSGGEGGGGLSHAGKTEKKGASPPPPPPKMRHDRAAMVQWRRRKYKKGHRTSGTCVGPSCLREWLPHLCHTPSARDLPPRDGAAREARYGAARPRLAPLSPTDQWRRRRGGFCSVGCRRFPLLLLLPHFRFSPSVQGRPAPTDTGRTAYGQPSSFEGGGGQQQPHRVMGLVRHGAAPSPPHDDGGGRVGGAGGGGRGGRPQR